MSEAGAALTPSEHAQSWHSPEGRAVPRPSPPRARFYKMRHLCAPPPRLKLCRCVSPAPCGGRQTPLPPEALFANVGSRDRVALTSSEVEGPVSEQSSRPWAGGTWGAVLSVFVSFSPLLCCVGFDLASCPAVLGMGCPHAAGGPCPSVVSALGDPRKITASPEAAGRARVSSVHSTRRRWLPHGAKSWAGPSSSSGRRAGVWDASRILAFRISARGQVQGSAAKDEFAAQIE